MGTTEIIIIVGVGLVLFGASAIPKFARSLGRAKKEFEDGIKEVQIKEPEKPAKKEEKEDDSER